MLDYRPSPIRPRWLPFSAVAAPQTVKSCQTPNIPIETHGKIQLLKPRPSLRSLASFKVVCLFSYASDRDRNKREFDRLDHDMIL